MNLQFENNNKIFIWKLMFFKDDDLVDSYFCALFRTKIILTHTWNLS